MPDDHFPDLMRQAGEMDAGKIDAFAAAVDALARSATTEQIPRLVDLAHGAAVERDRDEWFWRPFREADGSFPAEPAVPLHARLADACIRERLAEGRQLDAILVRLAVLAGREPVTPLLQPAADQALRDFAEPVAQPAPTQVRAVWAASDQKKLDENLPGEYDSSALTSLAKIIGANADRAIGAIRDRSDAVAEWAQDNYRRLLREQTITQWLVAGVRSDGTPWADLNSGTIAIDAAAELALHLGDAPPEPRHENLLFLVLRAAGVDLDKSIDAADPHHDGGDCPAPLHPFTPVHAALDGTPDGSLNLSARQAAVQMLWESVAIAAWSAL